MFVISSISFYWEIREEEVKIAAAIAVAVAAEEDPTAAASTFAAAVAASTVIPVAASTGTPAAAAPSETLRSDMRALRPVAGAPVGPRRRPPPPDRRRPLSPTFRTPRRLAVTQNKHHFVRDLFIRSDQKKTLYAYLIGAVGRFDVLSTFLRSEFRLLG